MMTKNENHIFVIFGASGDLTKRMLVPALYSLCMQKLLPGKFVLLGVSRSPFTEEAFRDKMAQAIREFGESGDTAQIGRFMEKIFYSSMPIDDAAAYPLLQQRLKELRDRFDIGGHTLFYLSTPPGLYGTIPRHLALSQLNREEDGWKRLIIEKPFGHDLISAVELKNLLLADWKEEQLFRMDHYLGKETVQNLLVTRFANGIFEPLWNRNYIHHVEITSAESLGVEKRGGYFDQSGTLRDMVQNHLLQLVAITAMEPPSSVESMAIRNEILKVFQALRPYRAEEVKDYTIRGQYLSSTIQNQKVKSYREEEGVDPHSTTETYAALKFYIDNWRWGGVPFYIRSGKRLPTRVTEVVIHFRPTPHFLFSRIPAVTNGNQLVIRIQPDEGMLIQFGMKVPGAGFGVQNVAMDFHYSDLTDRRIPSAYERLIYDAIQGDATLFARTEEVVEAWKFLAPVLESWKNDDSIPLYGYPAGTWGPEKADALMEGETLTWRYPCKNLSSDGLYCEL